MRFVGALAAAVLCCICCAPTSTVSSSEPPGWQLAAINAAQAWKATEGRGIVIAFLDSGLETSEAPGIRQRLVAPTSSTDVIGHGTTVTSVAVGSGDLGVWGVAPAASILPISITDQSEVIDPRLILDGIARAERLHANVINLSFGELADDVRISAAIEGAVAQGIVVVAAAGDTASPQALFPARLENAVIAVQAAGPDGTLNPNANAVGANGLRAPGEDLPALRTDRTHTVRFLADGSSVAAAVVSGAVALLLACSRMVEGPQLRQDGILYLLRRPNPRGRFFDLAEAMRSIGCA